MRRPRHRFGPELAWRNRRVLAQRGGWPEGALEACERLERLYPGRSVSWFPRWRIATPGFDREAGFYAWDRGDDPGYWAPGLGVYVRRHEVYGATAEALEEALA